MLCGQFIIDVDIGSIIIVTYPDLHSTERALRLVDSWSCAPDQIQMYPNWDTIAQL